MKLNSSSKIRTLPLQFLLIAPFVVQIIAIVSLVGYLSFRNGQKAIADLTLQLGNQVSDRVSQHLDYYLSTPKQLNEINLRAYQLGLLNFENFATTGTYFWKQMAVYNIGYVDYANQQGDFIGIERTDNGELLINERRNDIDQGKLRVYSSDHQGNRIALLDRVEYDPRNEDWYSVAIKHKRPVWSEIYQWEDKPEILSISSSFPVFNSQNQLIGVTGVDLILSQISDFLNQLHISPSGKVFIIEQNGLIVATSTQKKPYQIINGTPKRISALNIDDPLIQQTAQQIKTKFQDFKNLKTKQQFNFYNQQREALFTYITPWKDDLGLNWIVVIAIPESDFMEQIKLNTRNTIILCFLTLIIAIIASIIIARWITKPIVGLIEATQEITSGNLDQTVTVGYIQELNQLALTFNSMAQQLHESFSALEESNEVLEERVQARTLALKKALDDLNRAQTQMIQSEKMSSLGQVVAGVAHEINNPITFIQGNINHLQEYNHNLINFLGVCQDFNNEIPQQLKEAASAIDIEFMQEDLPKILSSIKLGTERVHQIVLSLRNFSRMDEADLKNVNIHEGIDSTLTLLEHQLQHIKIIKNYASLPLVECYASELNQVLMNLLLNAIDSINQKNNQQHSLDIENKLSQIIITTSRLDSDTIKIAIADTGVGIPPEIQSHIFDPFFTTKPIGKATGMGLAISYQIITQKHGGQLECYSNLGEGAEFVISLPTHQ